MTDLNEHYWRSGIGKCDCGNKFLLFGVDATMVVTCDKCENLVEVDMVEEYDMGLNEIVLVLAENGVEFHYKDAE